MVVKTDQDNKITGYVMTPIKNKHLAVHNSESYDILLEYFKMIGERLDKMQKNFKSSEFDTEVKKKALSKFNQFNKSVYYSVITEKFYIGQFKEVEKNKNISNSSSHFYKTLDKILYVGDIKISNKLVGNDIIFGGDLVHYKKSKEKMIVYLKNKFKKSLEKHKKTELDYISETPSREIEKFFKIWLRFKNDLDLSDKERIIFIEDQEYLKNFNNKYIDIDSRITLNYSIKLIGESENQKDKALNYHLPSFSYRVDSSFTDFSTSFLAKHNPTLLQNYEVGSNFFFEDKIEIIKTFEKEVQLAKLTNFSSIGEFTRVVSFRNKLKDISKQMTTFTNDFARATIENYCAANYK